MTIHFHTLASLEQFDSWMKAGPTPIPISYKNIRKIANSWEVCDYVTYFLKNNLLIYFIFWDCFDGMMLKIIFFKLKNYFNINLNKKYFLKNIYHILKHSCNFLEKGIDKFCFKQVTPSPIVDHETLARWIF